MSCRHCGALEQHGRFCVGCGTTLPPRFDTSRRISRAARPYLTDDMTQPVLRLRHSAPRVPVRDRHEVLVAQEIPA
jgi:hypothetical protein